MQPNKLTLMLLLTFLGVFGTADKVSYATPSQTIDLSSPVQPGSATTYLDLLRKLMPDAKVDSTAASTIPIRSISEPNKKESIQGPIKFEMQPHWFNSEGKPLLMLQLDLIAEDANQGTPYGGEAVVLAVYKLDPAPTLVDALEIKTDRFTGFWEDRPIFHLDNKNDAFIVYSSHFNAGESYSSLEMLFVDNGRLKHITSQFLFETEGCGVTFKQTPSFRTVAAPGSKYPNVLVVVKLTKAADEPSCSRRTRGYTRNYQGLYRWNAVKRTYEGGSRQLDALARFNEIRVSSP